MLDKRMDRKNMGVQTLLVIVCFVIIVLFDCNRIIYVFSGWLIMFLLCVTILFWISFIF